MFIVCMRVRNNKGRGEKPRCASIATVLDTKSPELAFLDILIHNSGILNAMTKC